MRSKTNCTGVPTPAASSSSVTRRSKTTCTLTIGDSPSSGRRSEPGTAPVGSSAAAARWGTASTTASASTSPSSRSTPRPRRRGRARCPRPVRRCGSTRRTRAKGARGRVRVQRRQRHAGPADVGGAAVREQPGLEDLRGEGQRRLRRGQVERRSGDEVPEPFDGPGRLALRGEPLAERALVELRRIGVEPPQRSAVRTADHRSGPVRWR